MLAPLHWIPPELNEEALLSLSLHCQAAALLANWKQACNWKLFLNRAEGCTAAITCCIWRGNQQEASYSFLFTSQKSDLIPKWSSLRRGRPLMYSGIEGNQRSGLPSHLSHCSKLPDVSNVTFLLLFPVLLLAQFWLQLLECSYAIII